MKKQHEVQRKKRELSSRGTQGFNTVPKGVKEQSRSAMIEKARRHIPKVDAHWSSNKTGSEKEGRNQKLPANDMRPESRPMIKNNMSIGEHKWRPKLTVQVKVSDVKKRVLIEITTMI